MSLLAALLAGAAMVTTPASISFIGTSVDAVDDSAYTFSGVNIGAAASSRYVILAIVANSVSGGGGALSSVTLDGNAMHIVATTNPAVTENAVIAWLDWPSGTTATIALTWADAKRRCHVGVFRGVNMLSGTPLDADTSTGSNPSLSLDSDPDGIALAVYCSLLNHAATWTGVTEQYDVAVESASRASGAMIDTSAASIAVSLSSTSGGSKRTSVATWR